MKESRKTRTNVSLVQETPNVADAPQVIQDTPTVINRPVAETTEETVPLSVAAQMMEQLKSMQQEIERLKNPLVSGSTNAGKERYKWPRSYSYSLFNGKAIVSMQTNKEKSKNYKNIETGKWTFLQIIDVTFHDGSTIEEDYEVIMRNSTKAEHSVPLEIMDKVYDGVIQPHYKFAIDGKTFFIPHAHIN